MQSRDFLVVDSVKALFDAMRNGKKAIFNQIRVEGETQTDFVTRITGISLEDGSYKSFEIQGPCGRHLYWHLDMVGETDDDEMVPRVEVKSISLDEWRQIRQHRICESDSESFKAQWQNIKGTI